MTYTTYYVSVNYYVFQKEVPKHIELANERLFVEAELHKEHQQKEDCSAVQKSNVWAINKILNCTICK